MKATSILSISGLPSPGEEVTSHGTVKQVVVGDRPVSSQHATNLKKSYVSEMEIDSKHPIKDYMSMDLLNVSLCTVCLHVYPRIFWSILTHLRTYVPMYIIYTYSCTGCGNVFIVPTVLLIHTYIRGA